MIPPIAAESGDTCPKTEAPRARGSRTPIRVAQLQPRAIRRAAGDAAVMFARIADQYLATTGPPQPNL
jgi:hypothetical protein